MTLIPLPSSNKKHGNRFTYFNSNNPWLMLRRIFWRYWVTLSYLMVHCFLFGLMSFIKFWLSAVLSFFSSIANSAAAVLLLGACRVKQCHKTCLDSQWTCVQPTVKTRCVTMQFSPFLCLKYLPSRLSLQSGLLHTTTNGIISAKIPWCWSIWSRRKRADEGRKVTLFLKASHFHCV